jgi:hypothetical protein
LYILPPIIAIGDSLPADPRIQIIRCQRLNDLAIGCHGHINENEWSVHLLILHVIASEAKQSPLSMIEIST